MTACAPVPLAAGSHRLTAARGGPPAWMSTRSCCPATATGEPAEVAPRGAPADLAAAGARPRGASASTVEAEVDSDGTPFWFVLGQSAGDGWAIDAEGAAVGPRTLVDGYANGWVVTPDGAGPVSVRLRWEPQRLVWVGLAASGVAVLACVVIVVRRRGSAVPSLLARLQRSGRRSPSRRNHGRNVVLAAGLVGAMALVVATPPVAVAASAAHRRSPVWCRVAGSSSWSPRRRRSSPAGCWSSALAGVAGRRRARGRPPAQPVGGALVGVTSIVSSGRDEPSPPLCVVAEHHAVVARRAGRRTSRFASATRNTMRCCAVGEREGVGLGVAMRRA